MAVRMHAKAAFTAVRRCAACPTLRPLAARDLSMRAAGPLQLHGLLARRMSSEVGKDSLLSSVFGAEGSARKGEADKVDEGETAGRHQNRHSKAGVLAEGKKTLKPWAGGGGAQLTEHIMDVHTENIKILVGKRGAKVHSMMEESGAKIFVSSFAGQDSSMRKVAIRGTPEAVEKAKELIAVQIQYAEISAGKVTTENLSIPAHQVGVLIGKSGATVKAIQNDTGAKVNLDTKNLAGGDPNIVAVVVSGSKEAVKNALHRIQSILADAPTSSGGGGGGVPQSSAVRERLTVPTSAVAMIIGKAGQNIRGLEAETGARIAVDKRDDNGDTRFVNIWSLTGDTFAVAAAKLAVEDTVAKALRFAEMRDDGGNYGDEGSEPSGSKSGAQRRSRMFSDKRDGRGRGGRAGQPEEGRGGGQISATISMGVSTRTTVSAGNLSTLVDAAAEVEDLKSKGHAVDDDASNLAHEIAAILALNPTMNVSDKRAFVRRFIKSSARPDEEYMSVLEM